MDKRFAKAWVALGLSLSAQVRPLHHGIPCLLTYLPHPHLFTLPYSLWSPLQIYLSMSYITTPSSPEPSHNTLTTTPSSYRIPHTACRHPSIHPSIHSFIRTGRKRARHRGIPCRLPSAPRRLPADDPHGEGTRANQLPLPGPAFARGGAVVATERRGGPQ